MGGSLSRASWSPSLHARSSALTSSIPVGELYPWGMIPFFYGLRLVQVEGKHEISSDFDCDSQSTRLARHGPARWRPGLSVEAGGSAIECPRVARQTSPGIRNHRR